MSVRDGRNWLIHTLYVRHEFKECLEVIEGELQEYHGLCEYPIYVKGMIRVE